MVFRFDLAGILGEEDLDYNSPTPVERTIVQTIADDPVMQEHNVRLISEPWTASGTGPGIGGFPMSSNNPMTLAGWNGMHIFGTGGVHSSTIATGRNTAWNAMAIQPETTRVRF